jgi:type IV secretory pathway VirB2 component (pilin)
MLNMKRLAFVILGIILLPTLALAGGASGSWTEPSGPTSGLLSGISGFCYENGNCTFCDVMKVGSNIFLFLRNNIAFPIAVLFIIYGGVMIIFAGGSKSQVENGKKVLFSALIGFAIVFSVSLILNSVLMILAKNTSSGWQAFINNKTECTINVGK